MPSRQYTIPTIFTAVNRFSGPLRTMQAHMGRFTTAAEVGLARAERAFSAIMAPLVRLKNMLRYFGFFGGFALVMAFGGALKIIADFEQANADLASVLTNVTRPELKALANDAMRIGLTTARTSTEVTKLQTELAKLGYSTTEILDMSRAIVTGSIAMDAALDRTALLTGAMIRTFDGMKSTDAERILNQMTLATLDTALSFEKLETMLPIVSGAANAVGIPFSRLLALLGKLSDAGIDASSSATALRNIFIDSRRRGHGYEQVLQNIQKHTDRLTPAFNKFGKRGAVSAVVLANKLKEVRIEDEKLINHWNGVAEQAAAKRLDTMRGSLTLLKSAYQGFILNLDSGNGPLSTAIRHWLNAGRGMLLLATGTRESMDAFKKMDLKTQELSKRMIFWIKVAGWFAAALLAIKVALIAARIAMVGYSVALGIMSALTGASSLAMAGNAVAIGTQTVALWLMNAATVAASAAFRTLLLRMGAIGAILYLMNSLIESFERNWDMIKKSFADKGFIAGLDAISATIMDGILYPLQQLFQLLSKIPIIGSFWGKAAKMVNDHRKWMGVNISMQDKIDFGSFRSKGTSESEYQRIQSTHDDLADLLRERRHMDLNGKMTLEYTAPPGMRVKSDSDSLKVIPKVGSSMSF